MARMSIDDKFLRDGRVKLLGQRFGWSRRETMGALLDVFAVAYDREDDVLPVAEVDAAADKQGFAIAMVEVDLGEMDGPDMRIKGAAERIEYLAKKREAGAKGGRKSGETRRNRREAKRSSASEAREAFGNPPDPVPDGVPVPEEIPPARDPAVPSPALDQQPAPLPTKLPETASDRDPKPRKSIEQRPERTDARTLMGELEQARQRAAAHLGVAIQALPFGDRGERDLAELLASARSQGAESVALVVNQTRHAIAMAELETTRGEKSIEWFTGAVFSPGNWRRLVAKTATSTTRAGPRSSAERAQPRIRPKVADEIPPD